MLQFVAERKDMNVTSEILFYLYSVKHPLIQEHTGLLNQPVTSIRRLVPGEEPDKEALYILTVDELKSIEDDGRYQHLLFVAPKGKLPTKKSLQKIKGKNYAFTNAFYTTYELQNALLTIFHDLLRQENELLLAAMDPTRAEEVFRFGAKWFPWEYSVVDIDMRYQTGGVHIVAAVTVVLIDQDTRAVVDRRKTVLRLIPPFQKNEADAVCKFRFLCSPDDIQEIRTAIT